MLAWAWIIHTHITSEGVTMTTSRGPQDAWNPGVHNDQSSVPAAHQPPPIVPANPAQQVPDDHSNVHHLPRPEDLSTGGSHMDVARHSQLPAYTDSYSAQANTLAISSDTLIAPPSPAGGLSGILRRLGVGRKSRLAELDAALVDAIRTPLPSGAKVAVVCAKGGVSKTVHTVAIGNILAQLRVTKYPSVAAIDFNPDHGTLGVRTVPRSHAAPGTIRGLIDHLAEHGTISTTNLERSYIGITKHNLGVIASGNSALDDREITAAQYESVTSHLHEVFPLMLIDTGNSMTAEVFRSILRSVDQIVLVGLYGVDAAITASDSLARIRMGGGRMEALANNALISMTRPQTPSPAVDINHIREHFSQATRHGVVREIPFDPHLNEGGVIDLDEMSPQTRREFMILTADIVHALAGKPLFSTSTLPHYR